MGLGKLRVRSPLLFLLLLLFWWFSYPSWGKTFCPACPQEKYVPSGMLLEKIRVTRETAASKERVRISLFENGEWVEVAVYFFNAEDFVSQRVRAYLKDLRVHYPSLRIVEGDIREKGVQEIKEALDNLFGVPEKLRTELPCLFIRGEALVGEKGIITRAEEILRSHQ
jgi:hypothetical protein